MQGDFVEAVPRVKQCIKWANEYKNDNQMSSAYNLFGRSCLYLDNYEDGIEQIQNQVIINLLSKNKVNSFDAQVYFKQVKDLTDQIKKRDLEDFLT